MMLQGAFRWSWICLLLFNIGACAPVQKSLTGHYHSRGSGYRGGSADVGAVPGFNPGSTGSAAFGFNTGFGSTSSFSGSSAAQDADITQMIANLLHLSPDGRRPLLQFHWSSPQVPLGMVESRPVYPSSLLVHSNSGYQRARDFRSDSKYTQDTFDNIPLPETPQNPGSGSKGHQMGQ